MNVLRVGGLCLLACLLALATARTPGQAAEVFSEYVSPDGQIQLPSGYRSGWEHLGNWAVSRGEREPLHEMHAVYSPVAVAQAFREAGEWPDGAVLVKEVRTVKSDTLNTGHAGWADEMKIWFVMVRDRENRFPDHPNWGEGWGWALFDAGEPSKNVSSSWIRDCRTCHVPARQTDWVFMQGYPGLQEPTAMESASVE